MKVLGGEGRRDLVMPVTTETVFLVGPARSGTTLLYKVLCLHPDVAFISNWRSRFPSVPAVSLLDRLRRHAPSVVRRTWFAGSDAYVYGRSRAPWDRAFPSPVEGEPVYRSAGVARPGGPPPASADPSIALPAAFGSIRALGGGSCLVSKRIANNLRIPLLHEIFPDARFVFLIRDGRAVAKSLARVDWWEGNHIWWFDGTPRDWRAEGKDPWELCAWHWVKEAEAIEEGLTSVPPQQILRLRYEDLVRDASVRFEEIATFLGLRAVDRWRTSICSLPIHDRNTRTDHEDPAIADTITAIQGPTLERYGYEA